jgi:hypothetical protein
MRAGPAVIEDAEATTGTRMVAEDGIIRISACAPRGNRALIRAYFDQTGETAARRFCRAGPGIVRHARLVE